MKKNIFFLSVFALCCSLNAQAQAMVEGKQVKRIIFDREDISVIYDDNTRSNNVQELSVRRQDPVTGVREERLNTNVTTSDWYTVDGRSLQGNPGNTKGVYVVKEGNKVRKVIKK